MYIENTTRVPVGRRFILQRVVSKTYLTSESELDTFGNHELLDKSSSTGTSVVFYFLHTPKKEEI